MCTCESFLSRLYFISGDSCSHDVSHLLIRVAGQGALEIVLSLPSHHGHYRYAPVCPDFWLCAGESNSGTYAFAASNLPTEPFL